MCDKLNDKTNKQINEMSSKKLIKLFITAIILQIFQMILRFIPFGEYDVSIPDLDLSGGEASSINTMMGYTNGMVFFIIFMLLSILLCFLPILKKNLVKRRRMIFSKIMAFWNVFTIYVGIESLSYAVSSVQTKVIDNYGDIEFIGSWKLFPSAYIHIVVTICNIVVLFMISRYTKKLNSINKEKQSLVEEKII